MTGRKHSVADEHAGHRPLWQRGMTAGAALPARAFSPAMRITAIRAYQIDLPLHEGSYKWSGGNAVSVFDSTIVAVDTDAGLTGWGEVCPLGPAYLPAYAAGARAGIAEIGPALIGHD